MNRFLNAFSGVSLVIALFSSFSSEAAFIDRIAYFKKLEREAKTEAARSSFLATTGNFDQSVDHLTPSDTRTFKQRYWISSTFASGESAPVVYYICGESRCSGPAGFAVTMARELRAHIVTLEHRYYGDSIPFPNLTTETLRYLSAEQALADLAAFEKHVQTKFAMKGSWIMIGGSYSGALAAYYRLKYPTLTIGSLASSGPVEARAKFEEYDYQVATVVSAECLGRIKKSVALAEELLKSKAGGDQIRKTFSSEAVTDDVSFLYVMADMAAAVVQYGDHENFCRQLIDASDTKLLSAYAVAGLSMFRDLGIEPADDVAEGNLSEDSSRYSGSAGMRQWYYQSCTEFGYWQVAYHDDKFSARSPRVDLAYHDALCERMFGIRTSVDTRTINDNYYEPLLAGKASQILFTNGADDPWKNLSISPVRGNVAASVEAIEITGASHCEDLGAGSKVGEAQNRFRELVKSWIAKPLQSSTWPRARASR